MEVFLLLFVCIVVGVMFCVFGWNKVFIDVGCECMVYMLVDVGILFLVFSVLVFGVIEWIVGGLFVLGLVSCFLVLLLVVICVVVVLIDGIVCIFVGLSVLDWLSWFFYLSEVLLGVLLLWIVVVGSGWFVIEVCWVC